MAFDGQLAERIHSILKNENPAEKRMFGGIGYLINGNMACGVLGENLIVRVGKDHYAELINHPSVKPFDLTGKAMNGWLEVLPSGTRDELELSKWIQLGVVYARTLPPK